MKYVTKQGNAILAYMSDLHDTHTTAEQIATYFQNTSSPIGLTTVYRHLDRLEKDGRIRKFVTDSSTSACYQYIEESCTQNKHFHTKCNDCGKLSHIDCETIEKLETHILQGHEFKIDSLKTIFYGKCKSCQ